VLLHSSAVSDTLTEQRLNFKQYPQECR